MAQYRLETIFSNLVLQLKPTRQARYCGTHRGTVEFEASQVILFKLSWAARDCLRKLKEVRLIQHSESVVGMRIVPPFGGGTGDPGHRKHKQPMAFNTFHSFQVTAHPVSFARNFHRLTAQAPEKMETSTAVRESDAC